MLLRSLTLRHFRNVPLATLEFRGRRQFLVGANGQGKTNLIEAAGFLTALRSFRTADTRPLIQEGEAEAAVAAEVEHETLGPGRVMAKLRRDGRELWWGEERVARLADHLGKFPTVVFSSQDLQLVRGAPAGRRRWLDLALSAMDATYLRALQTYARALAGRNQLLKRGGAADARQLAAFEHLLAPAGAEIVARRSGGLAALSAKMGSAYAQVAGGEPGAPEGAGAPEGTGKGEGREERESASLAYLPGTEEASADGLRMRLESGRARDLQMRTTLIGPHRDDFQIAVRGRDARDFASEGQQRSAVLALRLAQAAWFQERSGVRPVLLADDVLGELDGDRRRRFWAALDPEAQVIATGTAAPDRTLGEWQTFTVAGGVFSADAAGMGLPA
jgi:DNA replication and repair protein RecF